jgi:hypothetical protein
MGLGLCQVFFLSFLLILYFDIRGRGMFFSFSVLQSGHRE